MYPFFYNAVTLGRAGLGFGLTALGMCSWVLACASFASGQALENSDELRLNQIQVIGTHNSYHLAPAAPLLEMIRLTAGSVADSIDYSHLPLSEQLNDLHIRQIELDIYADPEGGLYAKPIGYQTLIQAGHPAIDPNVDGVLDRPGMKIIHSAGFDYQSTTPTLVAALNEVKTWSAANREHVPILILIELKDSAIGPAQVKPVPFDSVQLDAIDAEIRGVFDEADLVTPDSVRGDLPTLREAVLQQRWPTLKECRGKVLFAMDNGGPVRDLYLKDHPTLEKRLMFVSVDAQHPAAAFMKLNNPISQFAEIQEAVEQGFLVRTRADADTQAARKNDVAQREKALASGAQFISTDYPRPDRRWSDYSVSLPEGQEFRGNPVSGTNARK